MKNVLFATTAIVAFAGAAYADGHTGVSVSANARLGLIDNDDGAGVVGTSRFRGVITGTGATDSGLTFGGSMEVADSIKAEDGGAGVAANGNVSTGGNVFISGGFGTLTYGDTGDAAEQRVNDVDGVGLTALGDLNEITESAPEASQIRYDYDFDSFGFSISTGGDLEEIAVGVGATFGGWTLGLGYDDSVAGGHVAASVGGAIGAFSVKAAFATNDGGDDAALSLGYDLGNGLSLTAFASERELADGVGADTNIGIGASYDLGGGASIVGGVVDTAAGTTVADFGVSMSF